MIEATLTASVSDGYTLAAVADNVTVEPEPSFVQTVITEPYTGEYEFTPTDEAQTVPISGKRATQDIVINPIPSGGEYAWLGKDPELLDGNIYSVSDKLKNTLYNGWTPSTTAKTIVASATAGTFSADLSQYEYFLLWEGGVDPVYTGTPTLKAHTLLGRGYLVQELIKRPSNYANIEASNYNGNACTTLNTENFLRYYGSTTGSITYSWNVSYGFYFAATSATFANSTADETTVTIKTPTLSTRCSTTYFSTGNAALIDQNNSSYFIRGKLFRIKKTGAMFNIFKHIVDLINE